MEFKRVDPEVLKQIQECARQGKIAFATQDKIEQYVALLHDFMEHIVGCTAYILTDYSSIDEWASTAKGNEKLFKQYERKIRKRYEVDIKLGTKETYRICDILEILADKIVEIHCK